MELSIKINNFRLKNRMIFKHVESSVSIKLAKLHLANNSRLGERFSPDWSGYPANDDGDASRGRW